MKYYFRVYFVSAGVDDLSLIDSYPLPKGLQLRSFKYPRDVTLHPSKSMTNPVLNFSNFAFLILSEFPKRIDFLGMFRLQTFEYKSTSNEDFFSVNEFAIWDVALITLQKPFDVGLPYINPICLLPKSRVGQSKDWDGILFSALGRQ